MKRAVRADHTSVDRARGDLSRRDKRAARRQPAPLVLAPTRLNRHPLPHQLQRAGVLPAGRYRRHIPARRLAEPGHRRVGLPGAVVAPAHHPAIRTHPAHMAVPHSHHLETALGSGRPLRVEHPSTGHIRGDLIRHVAPAHHRRIDEAHPTDEIAPSRRRQRRERHIRGLVHNRVKTPAHHRAIGPQPATMAGPRRQRPERPRRPHRLQRPHQRAQPGDCRGRIHDPMTKLVVTANDPAIQRGRLQRPPHLTHRRLRITVQQMSHHPRHKRRRRRRPPRCFHAVRASA